MGIECSGTTKESPIDVALNKLKSNIGKVQETMTRFETKLASVLTEPEKSPDTKERATGQTSLESRLFSMCEDVSDIDDYLNIVQNRIQL